MTPPMTNYSQFADADNTMTRRRAQERRGRAIVAREVMRNYNVPGSIIDMLEARDQADNALRAAVQAEVGKFR